MRHELLILRHAKSSWDSSALTDFDRPLSSRGTRDATRLGKWLVAQSLLPDLALCSAAERARQTAILALSPMADTRMDYRESLYLAGLATLVNSIREQADSFDQLMLVGHNPGMDQLLIYLCRDEITLTGSGKLMTTATLARIECRCSWSDLAPEHCSLLQLQRPKR